MSPTSASSHELARRLVDRLQPHLPSNARLEADDGWVVVIINGLEDSRDGAAMILDDDDGRSSAEAVGSAAEAVLSHVQDRLSMDSAEPWPPSGTRELPLPGARVENGVAYAWYGSDSSPTLTLAPFSIDDDTR